MAGVCADMVTCVNVETHSGTCLNAPATSPVHPLHSGISYIYEDVLERVQWTKTALISTFFVIFL